MTSFRHICPRGRRGALLALTIWLIVLLMVMAYSLSYEMRIGLKMTSQGRRRVQAIGLARAGLAQGVMDLRNDQMLKVSEGMYNNDHLKEIWALTEDKTDVELGDGVYTVRVIDEQGKFDVNTLRPDWMPAMKYLLENVSRQSEEDAEFMAYALIDYLDADNRPANGEDASESEFYTAAAWDKFKNLPDGYVFHSKNDRLINIEELLEIPGFTRDILYGVPGEVPMDPIDRIDSKERSTALVDYVTVGQGGGVNINTAPVEVYGALLSVAAQGGKDVRRAADAIDDLRNDLLNRRSKTGIGFMSPGQISEAKIDSALLSGLLQAGLSVSSREYTIISRGTVGPVSQTLEARVVISLQSYNLETDEEPGQEFMHDYKAMGFLKNRPELVIDPILRVVQFKQY